jgi:hypothetical protein
MRGLAILGASLVRHSSRAGRLDVVAGLVVGAGSFGGCRRNVAMAVRS